MRSDLALWLCLGALPSEAFSFYLASRATGQYHNKIPHMAFPHPYTEICFTGEGVYADVHSAADESSAGGFCVPGDRGFVIEKNQRGRTEWFRAKAKCLSDNMRLPEPFEWQISCRHQQQWSLEFSALEQEWGSGLAHPQVLLNREGVGVPVLGGEKGCDYFGILWAGRVSGFQSYSSYRCAR